MPEFTPELGQAAFGQPHQSFEASELLIAALERIRWRLEIAQANAGREPADPFDSGSPPVDVRGVFAVHGYSWDDTAPQAWNFHCPALDLEVSWYKHLGRSVSASRELTPDQIDVVLRLCMVALDHYDRVYRGDLGDLVGEPEA